MSEIPTSMVPKKLVIHIDPIDSKKLCEMLQRPEVKRDIARLIEGKEK